MSILNTRSTLQLYKDCLRLAQHVGNINNNTKVLTNHVSDEFRKNMFETDPDRIEEQRGLAVKALTNFAFYTAKKDIDENN
eukprot:TRINITY_DN96338_c0_g1_i1.p1 TRINITY_DN96338_c0_g1~~TRINITY_DN96338_c0_g1_i1.p1  ORF type:complete len:81 (+),score=4.43 TRINITY_DN96338_c0_g1_i1:99-341(+)